MLPQFYRNLNMQYSIISWMNIRPEFKSLNCLILNSEVSEASSITLNQTFDLWNKESYFEFKTVHKKNQNFNLE